MGAPRRSLSRKFTCTSRTPIPEPKGTLPLCRPCPKMHPTSISSRALGHSSSRLIQTSMDFIAPLDVFGTPTVGPPLVRGQSDNDLHDGSTGGRLLPTVLLGALPGPTRRQECHGKLLQRSLAAGAWENSGFPSRNGHQHARQDHE